MTLELDVLCIGEPLIQLHPLEGTLAEAGELGVSMGGAETNVALSLAMLGRRAGIASRVGVDPLGTQLRNRLIAAGVDVSLLTDGDGPTGLYIKDPSAEGSTAHYYRARSAATRLTLADATSWAERVRPAFVHLSGITAMISDSAAQLARAIVVDRVFGVARVSFDVNMRRALADDRTPERLLELARASDVVFVGRDEAADLWGTSGADSVAARIAGRGVLVVKDGDAEAVSYEGGIRTSVPARRVDIIEPTGAGDAFAAGWLHASLAGEDAAARLDAGHRLAGQALRTIGDVPETVSVS